MTDNRPDTDTFLNADDVTEPAPYDPLAALTVTELEGGSRQLKASVVHAITGRTEHYEKALAVVAWLHARRNDPGAALGPFMRLSFAELNDQLSELAPDADPTTPTPSP